MAIRIGINPLTWTNDDLPQLGSETPLETCLTEAKQAGYAGMELGNKFPRTPDKLSAVMKPHGLDVVSGWFSGGLLERSAQAELDTLEAHLDLLHKTGSNVLVYCETTGSVQGMQTTGLSKRPTLSAAQWTRLVDGLNAVAAHTLKRGVKLGYHHHMGTVVQTGEEIDTLMSKVGKDVFLLLDTGHATYAGADPVALARKHGARVAHVHCKDVRKAVLEKSLATDMSFLGSVLEGVFTVPGDGFVDFKGVLAEMKKHQYSGWLVVEAEQDPKKAHPLTYAKMGFDNLTRNLKELGLS